MQCQSIQSTRTMTPDPWFCPVAKGLLLSYMSVEQIQGRDHRLLGFLLLRFGKLDPAHSDHAADRHVRGHAGHAQPEGPIQAVVQDGEEEEALLVVGDVLRQVVVSHGCQETQHTQGTEQS